MPVTENARMMLNKAVLLVSLSLTIFAGASCTPVPRDVPKQKSTVEPATGSGLLKDQAIELQSANPADTSSFVPLNDGNESLGARLRLIERAEHALDLQYFLMKPDLAAALVSQALLNAADRGVRVRLLLDDVFTTVPDGRLSLIDAHPNIEVRIFNPAGRPGPKAASFLTDFNRINRRMHNKSFTADGVAAIVGGRNIADEYFQIDTTTEFADFDLLIVGPAVQEIGQTFDLFWNDDWSIPIQVIRDAPSSEELTEARQMLDVELLTARQQYNKAVNDPYLVRLEKRQAPIFKGRIQVVTDAPAKLKVPLRRGTRTLAETLLSRFNSAKTEVVLLTPYFVPEDYGVRLFTELAQRGVKVRIVTNSTASTNHTYVQAGYQRHRVALLKAGVKLYEVRADSLQVLGLVPPENDTLVTMHTKLAVIDGQTVFVGSLNLDPRSVKQNTEFGVFLESRNYATHLLGNLEAGLRDYTFRVDLSEAGELVWHYDNGKAPEMRTQEPDKTFWDGVVIGITRAMGIELQL